MVKSNKNKTHKTKQHKQAKTHQVHTKAQSHKQKTQHKQTKHVKKQEKQKDNQLVSWILFGIAVIVILALIFYLHKGNPLNQNQANTNNNNQNNNQLSKSNTVQLGDTVLVNYVGMYENKTIFDTNIKEIAEKNNIKKFQYQPLEIVVGDYSFIKGFEDGLVGMKKGETKVLTIKPEDAYGKYDPTRTMKIPRINTINRTVDLKKAIEVPISIFKQAFKQEPELNKEYTAKDFDWPFKVINLSNSSVVIQMIVEVGKKYKLPGSSWNSTVIAMNDTYVKFRQDPVNHTKIPSQLGTTEVLVTKDKIKLVTTPKIGERIMLSNNAYGLIKSYDNDSILLDLNHPLAGKTLIFNVTVLNITKPIKTDKPDVDLYVMAFCPFGKQAEQIMYPVYKELSKNANINIHYVIYDSAMYGSKANQYCLEDVCSMHGIDELKEDMRQKCIANKYSKDVLWDYVDCVNTNCALGNINECWKTCANKFNIDTSKIQECQEKQGIKLMQAEKELNNKNNVRGSPTLFINNKKYTGARSVNGFKSAICSAMQNPPTTCNSVSKEVDTKSAGSCG